MSNQSIETGMNYGSLQTKLLELESYARFSGGKLKKREFKDGNIEYYVEGHYNRASLWIADKNKDGVPESMVYSSPEGLDFYTEKPGYDFTVVFSESHMARDKNKNGKVDADEIKKINVTY